MSKLPKAQGGLTAPSTPTTPKSSSTMDFTGSAGTINPTATNCPEGYEFDQSTGQCRPIITLPNVNVFSPRKYGQITQNLGPGVGQFTYRGNLATGAPKQSINDFSKPIIGRGLPGLDRQIRMGDLLANHRIASNEQIGRNFQIEQQTRARDIENNYNILRNTPGLKLYSDQELQRYAQQSKDKWPKFVQQNFDEESNTVYNVVNHPDYNPSVPVSSQRNLAADNSLRTMFLRGRNKMFGEFDRMNPVVGTALKVLASPGSSAANLMFDQQNRYLNPNQSVGQNLLNLGLDVASVAPIPVAQGVGTGLKTAVTTAGKYLNAPLTIGSRVFPSVTAGNLLAAYGASDFLVNRAPQIPGQIARGQYGEAALNTTLGTLDLIGANMVSPSLVNNAFRLANQGRQYLGNTYRNIAEGDNIFNYAWRSPAAGISDDVALGMYQQTRNSIPLDASARNVISDYQHTSGPFTGRFESGNVNLVKRLDLENAIAERNLVTQSGKPNVLVRRFDPDNPELYSLNESGQFILNRPTSWSVGRGWDYNTKPNRIVFKLPSGSRGMLNEYNAAKFDQDVSKLMVEKEAILGSGLNLGKRLGKVKNEFGGYDYIHRFEGYKPTEWDDIRRLNTENIGEIVDLSKNIATGKGNFNLGVYPFFKNPNILLKLGKVSQNEQFGVNNRNVVTGIPELLREMPTEAWGKIAIPFREINMSGLTSQTLNRPVIPNSEILGTVMQRVKGKPLYEYSVSDLENIQPWDYQDLANSVKHLANKGVSVDFYGDNFLLNKTDYGRNQFNLFDIGLLPNTNTGSFPVGPLYGLDAKAFSQGINRIDPKIIKNILQEKMRRAVYESASTAGEGAYSDQEIFDAIQRINDRIQRADIRYKKGGPIINQRGFMDGAPPQGSNWRIMGDGRGTSITMDLPNMPDEILVVPDGEFDQAKVMKKGEEEYFMGADFVDEYLLKDGGLTPNKAREILHDKEVHGRPLTEKQRRYFGAMSKGHTKTYQLGGKTDDEKRALAKRAVEIARRRAEQGQWVSVPQSIQDAAEKLGEPSNSCIGGVCDVLKEANVIPNVIWSNTEFARLAPSLGFNAANRGWGLKGIENLEPGDVVQWMDPNEKNPNKAVPHHGQIYLGTNSKGELEFFDNYSETVKSYPRERIEEQLSWTRKPAESQMQIYKINPYNPKPGNVNPEAQKALEEREANIKYQTGYRGALPEYEYSLRPDSPYINNPPVGMVKFLEKANDSGFIDDLVKSIDKAGYAKRATREQIHDSLLNVFGILGEENKWENPWVGGDITGGRSLIPIPLESTIERVASPSSMSIGPGQIKYSQLSKPIRKAFGINRRQDLQKWDKVIPLMVGLDIANKQWMENQGERFSERIIGQPGLRSTEFKWDEGRISPYFYRGPGIKNIRKYVESLYGKDWYDVLKPQYMQATEEMEEDPVKREQFVKDNIRQYQLVFDPGSYGQRVFENINKNLQRKILRKGEIDVEAEPMDAISLQEVILNSKRTPRRQLGGNALGMLRDYGAGISVPPKYQERPGTIGGREFVEQWMQSPMYNQMLAASAQGPEFERINAGRIGNLNIPVNVSTDISLHGTGTLGQKQHRIRTMFNATVPERDEMIRVLQAVVDNPKDKEARRKANQVMEPVITGWNIGLNPNLKPGTLDYEAVLAHEYGHTTDDPFIPKLPHQMSKKELMSQDLLPYIPKSDIAKMQSYYQGKVNNDLTKYVSSPQETRQYLTSLRYLGKTQGVYDPFTEKITPEQYRRIKPTEFNDPAEMLRNIYTDEQIIDMLNSISMRRNQGLPFAKSGGQHGGLDRWFAEKWVDVKSGKPCGRQEGESRAYPACRPSRRVSSETPKTSSEMSSAEREKFKRSKTSSERIPYSHKRRK